MRLINWGVKQPGQWNPLLPMAYQDQFFVRFSGLSSRREELLKENNTAERQTRLERTGTTMNPNGQYLPPIPPLSKGKQALDTLIGDLERDEDGEHVRQRDLVQPAADLRHLERDVHVLHVHRRERPQRLQQGLHPRRPLRQRGMDGDSRL